SCLGSAALIAGVPALTAQPAVASPAWSVVPSPSPPGPQGGELRAVAWANTACCVAVGNTPFNGRTTPSPVAQSWNGSNWTRTPISAPALAGVACISPTSCFAVGGLGSPTIRHWDGTSWSAVAFSDPQSIALTGISCPSATSCFAVGAKSSGGGGYALHWDGTSGSSVPNPSTGYLNAVSCTSTSFCVAVGQSSTEHWNG